MYMRVRDDRHRSVAVAIDNDKGSQYALKWATSNLATRGETVLLVHVDTKFQSVPTPLGSQVAVSDVNATVASTIRQEMSSQTRDMFLPYRCFCTRKGLRCKDVVLEDTDISKALVEYISNNAIENVVLGASARNPFIRRFKTIVDVPTSVFKEAPEFCTVYVISKGRISSMRSATRRAPVMPPLPTPIHTQPIVLHDEIDMVRSPCFTKGGANGKSYGEISPPHSELSYPSNGRPTSDRASPSFYDLMASTRPARLSSADYGVDNRSFEGARGQQIRSMDCMDPLSTYLHDSERNSRTSPLTLDELEVEMRRLRMELKQTMDLYSTACKEAITAKRKAHKLHRWKVEEEHRLEEARLAEAAALATAEKEKAKCRAAMEAAEQAQRIAELEAQKRMDAEMKAQKEAEEKKMALDALVNAAKNSCSLICLFISFCGISTLQQLLCPLHLWQQHSNGRKKTDALHLLFLFATTSIVLLLLLKMGFVISCL